MSEKPSKESYEVAYDDMCKRAESFYEALQEVQAELSTVKAKVDKLMSKGFWGIQ